MLAIVVDVGASATARKTRSEIFNVELSDRLLTAVSGIAPTAPRQGLGKLAFRHRLPHIFDCPTSGA